MNAIVSFSSPNTSTLRLFCDSIQQVVQSDDPQLLFEYIDGRRDAELKEIDVQGNSFLMLLLLGGAKRCALHLLKRYSSSINIHHTNKQKRTALHIACETEAVEVAGELIRRGSSMLEPDCKEVTALHIACEKGQLIFVKSVKEQVESDPKAKEELYKLYQNGRTNPLHVAARGTLDVLELVLEFSPHYDLTDVDSMTALHHSIESPTPFVNLRLLLSRSRMVDALDSRERSPLSLACRQGRVDLVELLLKCHADPNTGTPFPLLGAFYAKSTQIFEKLLKAHANPNSKIGSFSLLEVFCALDERDYCDLLIRQDADLSDAAKAYFDAREKPTDPRCPSHLVARGNKKMILALLNDYLLTFLFLIRTQPQLIPEVNSKGQTALHLSVDSGRVFEAFLLLQRGANPNAQDSAKNTPLHGIAATTHLTRATCSFLVDLLLSQGAGIELTNAEGKTALQVAWEYKNEVVRDALLKAGAACDQLLVQTCNDVNYPWTERVISACSGPLGIRLQQASSTARVSNGISNVASNGIARTALSVLLEQMQSDRFHDRECELTALFILLLCNGIDSNQPFAFGSKKITPLAYATSFSLRDAARALLEAGANVNAKTADCKAPIEIAAAKGDREMVQLLMQYRPKVPKFVQEWAKSLPQHEYGAIFRRPLTQYKRKRTRLDALRRSCLAPQRVSQADRCPSIDSHSPRVAEDDDIQELEEDFNEMNLFNEQLTKDFFREDTLDERLMRMHNMLSGNFLFAQEAEPLPKSRKLLTSEAVLCVMLPVAAQITNYSAEQPLRFEMRPMIQDRWSEVYVVKTDVGLKAVGWGYLGIQVREGKQGPYRLVAKLRIDGEISWIEARDSVNIRIVRSQLTFENQLSKILQWHIYQALNIPITYEMVSRSSFSS